MKDGKAISKREQITMTSYKKLVKSATKFLSMTGYTDEEFQALLLYFSVQFCAYMEEYTLEGKKRTRRGSIPYKNSPLPTIEDKLLFILIYLKTNNLQSVQAELFGMHQPEANQWIHLLEPLLNQALADSDHLPVRSMEELELEENSNLFFHDGTERPIQRPTSNDVQKEFYSGKKKQHTIKNNILSDVVCYILFLSPTVAGQMHDKKLADECNYTLPDDSILVQDTGFQGFDLNNVAILQPQKKPRNGELANDEKALNTLISRLRIRVEHAIGGVKRYRIIKDKIRNWKRGFRDSVIETCCGLHNFRLQFRPWNYALPAEFLI